jgi:hypothetical protein
MMSSRLNQVFVAIVSIIGLGLFSVAGPAQPGLAGPAESPGQPDEDGIQLPASNVLGAEDIWANPSFTGGTGNNGETASSEW